jgi:predicted nucleic acid-binding protein
MNSSNFPTDPELLFVADASVVINLNATGCASAIISVFPQQFVVTDIAHAELRNGLRNGHQDVKQLDVLIEAGLFQIGDLGETGCKIYEALIQGRTAGTLDDGEAATIGYASEMTGVALIDERKAKNICDREYPGLPIISTVDLLTNRAVLDTLGEQGQADAIISALRKARMRVAPHQIPLVIQIIGEQTAATCSSLPKGPRSMPASDRASQATFSRKVT